MLRDASSGLLALRRAIEDAAAFAHSECCSVRVAVDGKPCSGPVDHERRP